MRLVLTMMVRDAADLLQRAVGSALPYVDDVYIVDTGSHDETVDIARRLTRNVRRMPWPGHFSRARNWTLEYARGDFALVLDHDEYLEGDEWTRVRDACTDTTSALECNVVNILPAGKGKETYYQPRILRLHPDIRYTGKVHNQIGPALERYNARRGRLTFRVPARIIHTGYNLSPAELRRKYEPRLSLYAQMITRADTSDLKAYYIFKYGECLYMAGRYAECIRQYETVLPYLKDRYAWLAAEFVVKAALQMVKAGDGDHLDAAASVQASARLVRLAPREPYAISRAANLALMMGAARLGTMLLCRAYLLAVAGEGERHEPPQGILDALRHACSIQGLGAPRDAADVQALSDELESALVAPAA